MTQHIHNVYNPKKFPTGENPPNPPPAPNAVGRRQNSATVALRFGSLTFLGVCVICMAGVNIIFGMLDCNKFIRASMSSFSRRAFSRSFFNSSFSDVRIDNFAPVLYLRGR